MSTFKSTLLIRHKVNYRKDEYMSIEIRCCHIDYFNIEEIRNLRYATYCFEILP